jgi:hypothetical protein
MAFNLQRAHLRSCASPWANAWLSIHLVIPPFHLPIHVFSFVLRIKLGFPHSLAFKMTHCICGQLLYFVGTHFFVVPMVGNGLHPMMWFEMPLHPL